MYWEAESGGMKVEVEVEERRKGEGKKEDGRWKMVVVTVMFSGGVDSS
jgi:hypothetical protein